MEASYAKEPFDLRLLLLRLGRNLWKILALTILGTVLFGGGYYVKNVLLQPDPGYAASSTYKVEYVENPNAAGAYYINEATWNSLLHTGEFLDGVETHLQEAAERGESGAAAVLGAEPVVKCEGHKTAIAVSTVVIFGTISMFLYPILYRAGMLDALGDTGVAIYTGSTLHEVAHVAGAGNAIDPTDTLGIAGTATITKMIRVMMLAPVLVIMSFALAGRKKAATEGGTTQKSKITIPWFAFGFIGIICLNSLLQYLFGVDSVKEIPLNGAIEYIDTFMLTMAMTALGTDTSMEKFKQAGAKPFLLAGLLYIWLLGGGYLLTKWLVPMIG